MDHRHEAWRKRFPSDDASERLRSRGAAYLRNGGKLEIAQQMANHESARTIRLYDRRNVQLSLDEVERILI
ncbi:MAG: hypothetical protein ABI277_14785 [Burkholderiaceae bacterium]